MMFANQVFICHTAKHSTVASQIAASLRGRGYKVFLDQETLQEGHAYDLRIEKEVKKSSAFVFLLSPEAVEPGRYTLTELKFAQRKWPHPDKAVLPVQVEKVDLHAIPDYLKAVTILEPKGNLAAEVGSAIASFVPVRSRIKIFAAVAVFLIVLGGGLFISLPSKPSTYHYYNATARCSRTNIVARGTSTIEAQAESDAVENCVALGGVRGCCHVEDVTLD
jgi:hypothetical protein